MLRIVLCNVPHAAYPTLTNLVDCYGLSFISVIQGQVQGRKARLKPMAINEG